MSDISFSRNIEKWFYLHNITLLVSVNDQILHINIDKTTPIIDSQQYGNIRNIIGNDDKLIINKNDDIIIYQNSEYNLKSTKLVIPRFKFKLEDINNNEIKTNNYNKIKFIADKIGILIDNKLIIYNDYNLFSINEFNGKLIDIDRNFAIINKLNNKLNEKLNNNKNIIININSKKELISNYGNPTFLNEYNGHLYLIDNNLGSLIKLNPNTLECKKITIIPGNVIKTQLFENCLIITTNKKVDKDSVLFSLLKKNNLNPKNSVFIVDLVLNSIRYNVDFHKKEINSSLIISNKIKLINENDNILNEIVLFD